VVSENLPAIGGRSGRIQDDIIPADERALANSEASSLLGIETETEGVFASIQQNYSVRLTLECMRQLAKAFAGVPGRKSVIWATGGIPFSVDDPTRIGFLGAGRLSAGGDGAHESCVLLSFHERTPRTAFAPGDARGQH
jgi:hypothetical protein